MVTQSDPQIERVSYAYLIGMVRPLLVRLGTLEKDNQKLRKVIERLKRPKVNSQNLSQPPWCEQKPSTTSSNVSRQHLSPSLDSVILVDVNQCESCQHDLSATDPLNVVRRHLTDFPKIEPTVLETQQSEKVCQYCQPFNRSSLPRGLDGLETDRYFEPRLEVSIVFLKYQNHFRYELIVHALSELFGLGIRERGIAAIIGQAGKRASDCAAGIRQVFISSPIIQSGETIAHVKGRKHCNGVFLSQSGVYQLIVPRRNVKVASDLMGNAMTGVWVSDSFNAQMKATAKNFQLCIQHQLRDLKRILDHTRGLPWASLVFEMFRDAIYFNNRMFRSSPNLTLNSFYRRVSEIAKRLDRMLERKLTDPYDTRLENRFQLHRQKRPRFIDSPSVPTTNNTSEQVIITFLTNRKVTNGFQSEWVAKAYAEFRSVISNSKIKGKGVITLLVNLMEHWVIPFVWG